MWDLYTHPDPITDIYMTLREVINWFLFHVVLIVLLCVYVLKVIVSNVFLLHYTSMIMFIMFLYILSFEISLFFC